MVEYVSRSSPELLSSQESLAYEEGDFDKLTTSFPATFRYSKKYHIRRHNRVERIACAVTMDDVQRISVRSAVLVTAVDRPPFRNNGFTHIRLPSREHIRHIHT